MKSIHIIQVPAELFQQILEIRLKERITTLTILSKESANELLSILGIDSNNVTYTIHKDQVEIHFINVYVTIVNENTFIVCDTLESKNTTIILLRELSHTWHGLEKNINMSLMKVNSQKKS